MRTKEFDFHLPNSFVATRPASPRDSARLLEIRSSGELCDHRFSDLPHLLRPGDLLVLNDTRVIPASLRGHKDSAWFEFQLLGCESDDCWTAFARPARKLKRGDVIRFSDNFCAEILRESEGGVVLMKFSYRAESFMTALEANGAMPLPPYISKMRSPDAFDKVDYQTVFSRESGAVAAPTAGLHFTESLFNKLAVMGVDWCTLTLHIGAGTFVPVKTENIDDHLMHSEWGSIKHTTAKKIIETKARGGRVVAVGTTSLRLLEAACSRSGVVEEYSGKTDIFIRPGYRFRAVDLLVTNFHLPRSTLFMLVCAFSGRKEMIKAYEHAKVNRYRFFSYGDATLLERV